MNRILTLTATTWHLDWSAIILQIKHSYHDDFNGPSCWALRKKKGSPINYAWGLVQLYYQARFAPTHFSIGCCQNDLLYGFFLAFLTFFQSVSSTLRPCKGRTVAHIGDFCPKYRPDRAFSPCDFELQTWNFWSRYNLNCLKWPILALKPQ